MTHPFFDTNIIIDWLLRRPQAFAELYRYPRRRISRASRASRTEALAEEPIESRQRLPVKLLDAFILATAQVHGGAPITRNTNDFPVDMPGTRVPYTL